MRLLFAVFFALLLSACASGDAPPPPRTVAAVDLQRYQGTWYELARLPMFFQRNCVQSEARYSLRADGAVSVRNRCKTDSGEWQEAVGEAVPQVEGRTDKLWVRFDNWFSRLFPGLTRGEYWVLYLDDDYRTALVGHPNRKYLWLLSRTPEVDAAARERLLGVAREQGYDVSQLIWRQP
ncbi:MULTISPECIES: lipocalin family protein [Pseudomonas]|uniref:lipocalin family protein n=1 Tax=Pseudomonas TaxID=286 RepID=UPI002579B6A0|nr:MULTISPECIES: lipocalin family protein [Pseudomonas]